MGLEYRLDGQGLSLLQIDDHARRPGEDMAARRPRTVLTIAGSQSLAILHDGDMVLKHGPAEDVRAYADHMRGQLSGAPAGMGNRAEAFSRGAEMILSRLETIEIPVTSIDGEVLALVNQGLACTGTMDRIAPRLAERLAERDMEPGA